MRLRPPPDPGVEIGQALAKMETEKGLFISNSDLGERWIPKSQVHDRSEVKERGDEGLLVVSTWLAKQEGWS